MVCSTTVSVFMSVDDFSLSLPSSSTIKFHHYCWISTNFQNPIIIIAQRPYSTLSLPIFRWANYHIRVSISFSWIWFLIIWWYITLILFHLWSWSINLTWLKVILIDSHCWRLMTTLICMVSFIISCHIVCIWMMTLSL